MIVGIVGAEAAKFTQLGEDRAKVVIAAIVGDPKVAGVTSGHCHLGGVDIWAEEAAAYFNKPRLIFPAEVHSWHGRARQDGYRERNVKIALNASFVVCIAVKNLPLNYTGMQFKCCYHCARREGTRPEIGTDLFHIKSGGCWTMWYAIEQFKRKDCKLVIVDNF